MTLKRLLPLLAALSAALAAGGLVRYLDRMEQARYQQEARSSVLNSASAVRSRLESALNSRVFLARGLMVYVSTHPGITQAEFADLAAWLLGPEKDTVGLRLAKDNRVSHVYPLRDKAAVLGFDILADPERARAAKQAIESRHIVFAGPLDLKSGGRGFVARLPVYLTPPGGKPGSGRYWGLAQVVILQDALFREAGLLDPDSGLDFALRGKDGEGAAGSVFWGNPALYGADPVVLDINLPHGSWQLAATPKGGWRANPTAQRLDIVGGILTLAVAILAWFVTRNPLRLRELADQASRALVENEIRMKHLFDQAPVGMVRLDTEGRITDCNRAFLEAVDGRRSEAIGFNMATDARDATLVPHIRRALAGEASTLETTYTSTLGNKRGDYRFVFQPILLQKQLTGVLVFVEDISERKNAERKLHEIHAELENRVAARTRELTEANRILEKLIEEREQAGQALQKQLLFNQALFNAIPNPVFYKDREGRYLGCNEAFSRFYGLSPEDMVGKTVYEVAPKETADVYRKMDDALFAEPGLQIYEYNVPLASGDTRSLMFNKATFNDSNGNVAGLVGVIVDLTERKREQEQLAEAEALFRGLVEQSLAGIYIIQDRLFAYVNPRMADIFGYTPEEMLRLGPYDIVLPEEHDRLRENIRKRSEGGAAARNIYRARRKDGSLIEVEVHSRPMEYQGRPALIGILLDITEQQKAERQLNFLAFYDVLTGLANRTLFLDHLKLAMAGAKRHDTLMALHFLDLDRFKEINDTLGHHVGDLLLQSVAARLKECLRDTDTVARLGGDEFAIIQTDLEGIEGAETLAAKIMETLASPFNLDGNEVYTSTSIGITVYPVENADPEQLLKNADMAMYAAKNQGRNNFQFFSSSMNVETHHRMTLQAGLRQALERGEFLLYYQPKVSLQNGRIVGAEALLRWRAADGKLVPPNDFIPVAEESGLIVPIGAWVLAEACRQTLAWQEAGHPTLRMSVNLSTVQFKRNNLIETVTAALRESGLSPQSLELEITESLLMDNDRAALDALEWLRELGVRVSVDDFGTGYSSLNYLKRLPVDVLKIDRSFIDDIPHNSDDVAIARSIISLGHHLNLNIVAEGVETAAQAEFLLAHGCDEVQGFYFSRPVPAEEFEALLGAGAFPMH
jgi:diguanylate cyclase (GGDEF)-like protein/PAS domain S-box-containing protein